MLRQINAVLCKGFNDINNLSRLDNRRNLIFTKNDWEQLTEICEILEPFREQTDALQAEKVCLNKCILM